jgi:hypothetical protein
VEHSIEEVAYIGKCMLMTLFLFVEDKDEFAISVRNIEDRLPLVKTFNKVELIGVGWAGVLYSMMDHWIL